MRFIVASSPPSLPPLLRATLFTFFPSAIIVIVTYCCALSILPTTTIVSGFVPSSSLSNPITNYGGFFALTLNNNGKKKKDAMRETILKYNEGGDLSSDNHRQSNSRPTFNARNVLSDTEIWISKILDGNNKKSSTGSSNSKASKSNPYTRKEVSFFCERNTDSPMIVANVFRRLRGIREQGEKHEQEKERHRNCKEKEENIADRSSDTFRQTQVIAIPWNEKMNRSFHVFNNCMNAINEARRNSMDLVTDTSFEILNNAANYEDQKRTRDWIISVSSSHLHPDFESKPPAKTSPEMKLKEKEDANLQEYKKKRLLARQSPYPTIVMEVKALPSSPSPTSNDNNENDRKEKLRRRYEDFASFLLKKEHSSDHNMDEINRKRLTATDVQKLEALFSKPAYIKSENNIDDNNGSEEREETLNDSIGKNCGIQEISPATSMSLVQNWVTQKTESNDNSDILLCSTVSQASHTDEAFEFVFVNLAMLLGIVELKMKKEKRIGARKTMKASRQRHQHNKRCFRQYLVMPSFLPSSATSLEKFTNEVQKIIDVLPIDLFNNSSSSSDSNIDNRIGNKIHVSNFHPEHIDPKKRSPVSMVALQLQL